LYFYDGATSVIPWKISTNAASDNYSDLGHPSYRWKDLYLSGGVFLGGVGSANKLDDYEEGTWTPVYYSDTDNPTSTYDATTAGRYTKTGNIVVASCLIRTDSVSGGSGNLKVNGLPFTSKSSGNFNVGNGIIGEFASFGGDFPSHARVQQNSTLAAIMYRTSANGAESAMQISDLATGANSNTLAVTFIYEAA